jgi:hypothetical protein
MEEKKVSKKEGSQPTFFYSDQTRTIQMKIDNVWMPLEGHWIKIESEPDPILYV